MIEMWAQAVIERVCAEFWILEANGYSPEEATELAWAKVCKEVGIEE